MNSDDPTDTQTEADAILAAIKVKRVQSPEGHLYEGRHTRFYYNATLAGPALIEREDGESFEVELTDMLNFVAALIFMKRIERSENHLQDGFEALINE